MCMLWQATMYNERTELDQTIIIPSIPVTMFTVGDGQSTCNKQVCIFVNRHIVHTQFISMQTGEQASFC